MRRNIAYELRLRTNIGGLRYFKEVLWNTYMAFVNYRCPNVGLVTQGWADDDPADAGMDSFELIYCAACTRTHLINPRTGNVIIAEDWHFTSRRKNALSEHGW